MGIQHKPFLFTLLGVVSTLATGQASSAPFAWHASFEGQDAGGAVHGQLFAASSSTRSPQEAILPDGSRTRTYSFSSFDWGEGWSQAEADIRQSEYHTQDKILFTLNLVATRLTDGSSRFDIDWAHWPIIRTDNYGTSQTTNISGGLRITSGTDELFEHAFAPWTAVTSASGFTKIDTPPYQACGRFDCFTVPGNTQTMPFTVTSISAVPEPGAMSLLMGGALALGATAVWRRAKDQARTANA